MTKDELLKAIEENTQGPRWWEGIITAVDAYSSALLQQTPCTTLLPDEDICDRCNVKMKNNGIFLWCPSCRQ